MTETRIRRSSANPKGATYDRPRRPSAVLRREYRAGAGRWLCNLRKKRGLTQRGLAQKLGSMYTFISQVEVGRRRLPPEHYLVWADALGVDPREFIHGLLRYYEPLTHQVLSAGPTVLASEHAPSWQDAGLQGVGPPAGQVDDPLRSK